MPSASTTIDLRPILPISAAAAPPAVRLWSAVRAATLLFAAVGFALYVGLQYGRSNHWQYLLHGLHSADPAFLANDWFTQTRAHHPLFNALVAFAAKTGRPGVVLGLANGATSLLFAAALYGLTRRAAAPDATFGVALLLAAGSPRDAVGHSNILLPYFVPSVFGGTALLAAFALLRGRDESEPSGRGGLPRVLLAGGVAAIGCAMHANYFALVGPLWVCLWLWARPALRGHDLAALLLPWLLAGLVHVPFFAALSRDTTPRDIVARIFFDLYASMHYRPAAWPIRPWVDLAATLLAGWLAARSTGRDPLARGAIAALLTILIPGAIFTAIWPVNAVVSLYPWRLVPLIILAAQVAAAGQLTAPDALRGRAVAATLTIVGLLLFARLDAAVIAPLLSLLIVVQGARFAPQRVGPWLGLAALAVAGGLLVRRGMWERNRFGAPYRPADEALYAWVRTNTPHDAIFAVPPDCSPFRLETSRAVIVDWKCMPLLPADQREWLRRHERQAGRAIDSEDDAIAAYATLDAARAERLADEFGCRYVVLDRRRGTSRLPEMLRAFRTERYDLYDLARGSIGMAP